MRLFSARCIIGLAGSSAGSLRGVRLMLVQSATSARGVANKYTARVRGTKALVALAQRVICAVTDGHLGLPRLDAGRQTCVLAGCEDEARVSSHAQRHIPHDGSRDVADNGLLLLSMAMAIFVAAGIARDRVAHATREDA